MQSKIAIQLALLKANNETYRMIQDNSTFEQSNNFHGEYVVFEYSVSSVIIHPQLCTRVTDFQPS